MKKQLQWLLLFVAFLMPGVANAQAQLTVANGTVTNEYVPVYGYYADAYLRAQMIYPGTDLAAMTGGVINSMTFYCPSSASADWGTVSFQVKVGTTTATTLSSWSTASLTTVYSGTLSVNSSGQMVVNFTTPYSYTGGNLLVEVVSTSPDEYEHTYWVGVTSTGSSLQGYDYDDVSYITPDQQDFLPKLTFGYVPGSSTCPMPFNLTVTNIGLYSADLTWSDTSSASAWRVWWAPADTLSQLDSIDVYDTTYSFYGLSEGTSYIVRVASLCSGEDSYPASTTFTTTSTVLYYNMTQSIDTVHTCHAYIYDNGGPTGDYSSNANRTLVVLSSSPDSVLTLSGTLNSETNYDYLAIYDGIGTSGTQLYRGSGTATIGPFTSQAGAFTIVFTSDVSVTYPGYELHVQCAYIPCPSPYNVVLDSVGLDWASISWQQNGTAYSWVVEYDTVQFIPGSNSAAGQEIVYDSTVYLMGLDSAHTYYVSIHADCGGDTSENVPFQFNTLVGAPASVPYFCDFEASGCNGWELVNGTQTNYWMVGNATGNTGRSLYITNDDSTNAYTTNSISYSYAVRVINLADTGEYAYSYDWKCQGESHYYDFTRVFLTPATEEFTAGTILGGNTNSFATTAAPAGWYELTQSGATPNTLSQSSSWQTVTGTLRLHTPGSYKLVFVWANDGSGGTQPPTAIDNVGLTLNTCPEPTGLHVTYASSDTVIIGWLPGGSESQWEVSYDSLSFVSYDTTYIFDGLNPNTDYTFRVRALCDGGDTSLMATISARTDCGVITQLPYTESFEGLPAGTSSNPTCGVPCWGRLDNASQYHFGYVGSPSSWPTGAHTGSGFLYYYMPTTTGTYADWIITILPDIDTLTYPLNTLQVSFWVKMNSATTTGDIQVGVISDVTDATTFQPVDTVHVAGNNYDFKTAYLSRHVGAGSHIALKYFRNASTTTYYFFDDVTIEPIPDCPPVTNITLAGLDSNELTVTWTENGTATSWDIEYGPHGFTVGTGFTDVASGTASYTLTSLTPNTEYDIYITPVCGSGVSVARMGTFRTANSYLGLPFVCNFEDSVQNNVWTIENGTLTNKWYIGTATANGGSHSLYISNTNGTSCAYTVSSSTVVYAYADVLLDSAGDYVYSFDWKSYGESSYDYIRAALVPVSTTLTASTSVPSGMGTASLPTGWIALDGGSKLNLQSNWQTRSDVVTLPSAGVYHLVFVFRCDGSGGSNPPAAIDNVQLMRMTCPRPTNLTLANLSQTGADVFWHEVGSATEWEYQLGSATPVMVYDTTCTLTGLTPNTAYTFRVRAICGAGDTSMWLTYNFRTPCGYLTLPYTETFESASTGGSTDANFVDCMTRLNNGSSYFGYPYVSSSSTYNHTTGGTKGLYWYCSTTTGTYGDYQVVVLPPVDSVVGVDSLQFTFWAKSSSTSYSPVFKVGVMTDPNNIATFVPIDTITIPGNTTWTKYEVPLTRYTGTGQYVALRADRPSSSWYAYVDDLSLDYTPTCPGIGGLTSPGNTATTATLDWTERGTATEWEVAMELSSSATPTGDSLFSAHPATFTGLTTGTTYYFWVRPVCGVGDTGRWEGPIAVTPGSWNMRPNMTDTVRMCGGVLYDDAGINTGYANSQDSYIILFPDAPQSLAVLNGTVATETCCDRVVIYDGIGTSGTQLFYGYGTVTNVTSTTGPLTIYFHTDGSVNSYQGFELAVTCLQTRCRVMNLQLDASVPQSSSQLALTWDTNGAYSYEVEYGTPGFTQGTGTQLTTSTNSIVITGLTGLTSYEVYVRSICGVGDTGDWAHATFQTAMCDNVQVVQSWDSTWSASTDENAPMGYSYYDYGYVQTLIDSAQLAGLTGDITAFAFKPATASQGSYYNHMTIYMANVSETSLTDFIHPDSNHVFVQVMNDANLCYSDANWQLHGFDTTFAWDGHSNVLFVVKRDHGSWSDGSSFQVHTTSAVKTIYAYQDDDPFSIATASDGDPGYFVGDLQFYSCGAAGCRPPVVTSSTVTATTADFVWSGTYSQYEVALKPLADANWPASIPLTTGSYSFTGLQPATNYAFRVRQDCSVDSLGYSAWSIRYFVTDSLGCVSPTAPTLTGVTNNTASFSWTPVGDETAWQMRVFNSAFDTLYAPVTTPAATVTGLTTGVTYFAAVRALCGSSHNMEGPWSDSVQFVTQTCPTVTGVTTGDVTFNSLTLSWTAVPMAQSYEIEYGFNNFNQGNGTQVTATTNSITIVGLMDETTYQFYVRAVCGTNWLSENWSTPVSATTGTIVGTTYIVTLTANNNQWGRVTGGGLYAENSTVEIEAIPYDGYTFEHWSDDVTTNPRRLTVTSDTSLIAYFAPIADSNALLTVNYNHAGWGYVTINGREADTYNGRLGDEVSLKAFAYEGYTFVDWSDGVTDAERTLTLRQNHTDITANFTDGTSAIATVEGGVSCRIYPNPATSATTISVSGATGQVHIAVIDINGREAASETMECAGDCVKTMNVDNLSQGAYFVRITGEQVHMVCKLIVR